MGSDRGEFWWRISRFSWFGHQSRFDRAVAGLDLVPFAPFSTGHLLSLVISPPARRSRKNAHVTHGFDSGRIVYPRGGRKQRPPLGCTAAPPADAPGRPPLCRAAA